MKNSSRTESSLEKRRGESEVGTMENKSESGFARFLLNRNLRENGG